MQFYLFQQNNSGGNFVINSKVNKNVFIQANNAKEANELALEIGIYFDGVEKGCDCSCCGDRWYEVSEYNAQERVRFTKFITKKETIVYLYHYGNLVQSTSNLIESHTRKLELL